jgi:hypothetical protein
MQIPFGNDSERGKDNGNNKSKGNDQYRDPSLRSG